MDYFSYLCFDHQHNDVLGRQTQLIQILPNLLVLKPLQGKSSITIESDVHHETADALMSF
jgi:hypothetical protein